MAKITTSTLLKMKQQGQKISTITAYDASFAKLFDQAGIHAILIGDSLGMVLQGQDDTLPVDIDHMAYHTQSVKRGVAETLIISDMPFMTYATKEQAFTNAAKLMQAGASMVKMEGGEWLVDTIKGLVERGIPVCAHLGLTPQSVNVFGGFKVQGREKSHADKM
ncbi:MAG: 3-methyl-2-oxobutanoate hydroxymethyltransferase, partial [Colwellia sp.]